MRYRLSLIVVLTTLISGCASEKVSLEPTIASLSKKAVRIKPQAEFEFSRQQAIDSYQSLLESKGDDYGSGDEIRRFADLKLEASLDNRFADDLARQRQGQQESIDAINGYQEYLRLYPARDDNDYILYQLSRAYALDSQSKKSLATLDQLVSKFPDSQYIDEVQFRRGESLFVLGKYGQAEAAYKVIVKNHPDSLFYEKSIYKYGWSQFKQNRYRDAIDSYIAVLDINAKAQKLDGKSLGQNLNRAEKELLDDVVRVASLAFFYEDENISLSQYFKNAGNRTFEPMIYFNLGELYLNAKQFIKAAELFLTFGQQHPFSEYTPEFHQKAITSYQSAGLTSMVLKQKVAFVNRYSVGSDYWRLQSFELHRDLAQTLINHLRDLTSHFHAQARASKKSSDFKVSADWYRKYLKIFPQNPQVAKINFLLAENLFDARQYSLAVDEYEYTAYHYRNHRYSAEAGYAALLSYDAIFQNKKLNQDNVLQQKRVASALKFSLAFPRDPRVPEVLLQSAKQLFEWEDYLPASQAAYRLVANQGLDKKIHRTAWTIIGHSLFTMSDYDKAEDAYMALLPLLINNPQKTKEIHEQIAASIYRQGELARDDGNHALAALHFSRLAVVVPESSKRIIADYDAATAYAELKDWPQVITLLNLFRIKYPEQDKWSSRVSEKLALAYSKLGEPSQAANEMMAASSSTQSESRKKDLLVGAAELFHKSGNKTEAINIYKAYISAYPAPLNRAIELRFRIAEFYREESDAENWHFWLKDIIDADAKGKTERSPRSRYLAATASIELTKPIRNSFYSAKLTVPLSKSLKTKKDLMQKSINAYSKAIKYQVEEVTTEATYQIAEIYHSFANALLESQRPEGLNEDALEEYDLLLEEQAFPFEEKAIEIHLTNFRRIPQSTYNQSVKNSLNVLGKLMPFRYGKVEVTDAYTE